LPSADSATLALRTQQILGYESGLQKVVDPLAGSWYVEALTDRIEAEARALVAEVDRLGGAAAAIDRGYFQEAIAQSAWQTQQAQESGEQVVVGVNRFTEGSSDFTIPRPDYGQLALRQQARLAEIKARREQAAVRRSLTEVSEAARGSTPLMPRIIEAVRARATLGEISDALCGAWGVFDRGRSALRAPAARPGA
jgi:methylmalonyl-CoA mutase N-terminal domain/subunit